MAAALAIVTGLLPSLDSEITTYIDGFFSSDDDEDSEEGIREFIRPLLEGEGIDEEEIEAAIEQLQALRPSTSNHAAAASGRRGVSAAKRLDKAIDMKSNTAISFAATMTSGPVDIESTTKGRTTQVDIKKLEKAEAKIKAKMQKRSRRTVEFEGSKLVDAAKVQREYEEMYMQVNPLQSQTANKGKSKDILLEAIDVSFGSNRILANASLTLAHGRRYGLIGRNGVGKSTLLRAMAFREVPIPSHISILMVEQEVLGDDTVALDSVLKADVWRDRLTAEEKELNALLASLETTTAEGAEDTAEVRSARRKKEDAASRLGEVQQLLVEMEAESAPARAAALLAGLGFSHDDQKRATKTFSGGWRMRLSLARALFCKPDLLMLDEPSNNLDLNALAWLEDYLQTWPNTLLVVSHDRAFLDAVATDIVWQVNQSLNYFKGNFSQFHATKSERTKNQKREYESQMQYRAHLQAFIDRWRYNANRAAQAQSKIKILEKLPELEAPEEEDSMKFKFAEADKLSPPMLQLSNVTFGYSPEKTVLRDIDVSVDSDSRIGIIGPNGAGKSTLLKLLIGELQPSAGQVNRNGRLRIAYFAQHHLDQLDLTLSSVAFLASRFPGRSEQEYRQHLGAFGITGMTGLQTLGTLSGGQKSRVTFALLSLQRPHILLLDEPTNHLDVEAMDALMEALKVWSGGVICISHDSTFVNAVCQQLYVCANGTLSKWRGDVSAYKSLIVGNAKDKPT